MSDVFTTLIDKSESEGNIPTRMEVGPDGIYVFPTGYGDSASEDGHGSPVMLELYEGELRVVVWADINETDPTHIISLEKALESNREIPDEDMPNFCHSCGLEFSEADFTGLPKNACPSCGTKINIL